MNHVPDLKLEAESLTITRDMYGPSSSFLNLMHRLAPTAAHATRWISSTLKQTYLDAFSVVVFKSSHDQNSEQH